MTAQLFMLDTDTCIFLMRGESQTLATKVQSVLLQQQVMSAVTFAELAYGVQASAAAKRKQNQAVLDSLALHLAVLDWPQDAAKHYAEIRADLKKRGAQIVTVTDLPKWPEAVDPVYKKYASDATETIKKILDTK